MIKECAHCGQEFEVRKYRADVAKFCSRGCSAKHAGPSFKAKPNTICTNCGVEFHIKESQKRRYARNLGYFCSSVCLAEFRTKTKAYSGNKNPNWKGKTHDCDGYRLYVPPASSVHSKKMKLHTAVCCEVLGVSGINGFHVHHRDCDVENNRPENLVVLNASDHKWLHKQYGSATLWAFMRGKIAIADLISWSDDKRRAARLLPISVLDQTVSEIGVVKEGELLESLEEGNQQPSFAGNSVEGSETRGRPRKVPGSNSPTSALRTMCDDIVRTA